MANKPRPECCQRRGEYWTPKPGAEPNAEGMVPAVKVGPEYGWRFRDGNGRITFIGGEGFTRRTDAHRAFRGAATQILELIGLPPEEAESLAKTIEILDVEE